MRNINMADPHFTQEDRDWIHKEVDNILDGSLSMGPNVMAFEKEFASRVGVRHAIAMNSCTAALEASLCALGVYEREVIVPSETFIATGMAVHLSGGRPVFAEISATTLCLDLEDVKLKVNSQTAGVILVHMTGLVTPNILDFRKYCDDRGLFLIEDAAHAPGACYLNQQAGSIGDVGCFSFYPTKVITSGEGGMLTTNNDKIAAFARSYQHRGRDMDSSEEIYIIPSRNNRMTEMSALLGRVQLSHLDEFINRRRQIAKIYIHELSKKSDYSLIVPKDIENSSFWKFPVLFNSEFDRKNVEEILQEAGIRVDRAYQPALHLQPVFMNLYRTNKGLLPNTEDILSRHLCLPCHPRMSDNDVIYVSKILNNAIININIRGFLK